MQLVILAAGKGTRLGTQTQDMPKSLVSVDGVSYLSLQLQAFRRYSFSKKIIVGGYAIDKLASFLHEQRFSDFDLIDNPRYEWGNLYSLLTAKNFITSDFYLFNADHYYSQQIYDRFFDETRSGVTVFCDHDRVLLDDDMKIFQENERLIVMDKTLKYYNGGYVGVTRVSHDALASYWSACDSVKECMGRRAYVEAVVNELVARDVAVTARDISDSWWTEIDTPEDLKRAHSIIKTQSYE